jgi:hypothetical protein
MKSHYFKSNKRFKFETSKEIFDEETIKKDDSFSGDISRDEEIIKKLYNFPHNIDFQARQLTIPMLGKEGVIFYIPSLTDVKMVDAYHKTFTHSREHSAREVALIVAPATFLHAYFLLNDKNKMGAFGISLVGLVILTLPFLVRLK